jgi:hypothetical protein
VNDADRKIKTLYEQVRPETIEAAVAEARKLAPDLTDEGRRLLEVLLAMQQGLQLAAGRLAKRRASDARNGPWGLAVALSVVGLAVAALVERILVSEEGPRRWSQGAMSMVAFVLVTGGLFITARWYLRGRRLRDRR